MSTSTEDLVNAKLRDIFVTAANLGTGLFQVEQIDYNSSCLTVAVNSLNDLNILLPERVTCSPCKLGRLSVTHKVLESCSRATGNNFQLSGLFIDLRGSTISEATALLVLTCSYLSNPKNSSLTEWLRTIADLFSSQYTQDSIGLAGELLFLYISTRYNPDIIRCWNPLGFSPFDFSPPPDLLVESPYKAYYEVKATSIGSGLYTLKTSQLRHQASLSRAYTYVFAGIALSADGVLLVEFCRQLLSELVLLDSMTPDLCRILNDKVGSVQALVSLTDDEFRFDPTSSTLRLVKDQNVPVPENLHPAITIEQYYVSVELVSSFSIGEYFESL